MKKKVIIPENISDISLGQYQKYFKLSKEIEGKYKGYEVDREFLDHEIMMSSIEIFTGLTRKEVQNMQYNDMKNISKQIDEALQVEGEFKHRFKLKDIEFGLIPNFDKMTAKEFVDLSSYGVEVETLHNVMAILYRPIKDNGKTYTINDYNGTKGFAKVMKEIPLSYVNGALGFFLTLQTDLLNHLQKSIIAAQRKEKRQDILTNGDGMLLSMN